MINATQLQTATITHNAKPLCSLKLMGHVGKVRKNMIISAIDSHNICEDIWIRLTKIGMFDKKSCWVMS